MLSVNPTAFFSEGQRGQEEARREAQCVWWREEAHGFGEWTLWERG